MLTAKIRQLKGHLDAARDGVATFRQREVRSSIILWSRSLDLTGHRQPPVLQQGRLQRRITQAKDQIERAQAAASRWSDQLAKLQPVTSIRCASPYVSVFETRPGTADAAPFPRIVPCVRTEGPAQVKADDDDDMTQSEDTLERPVSCVGLSSIDEPKIFKDDELREVDVNALEARLATVTGPSSHDPSLSKGHHADGLASACPSPSCRSQSAASISRRTRSTLR